MSYIIVHFIQNTFILYQTLSQRPVKHNPSDIIQFQIQDLDSPINKLIWQITFDSCFAINITMIFLLIINIICHITQKTDSVIFKISGTIFSAVLKSYEYLIFVPSVWSTMHSIQNLSISISNLFISILIGYSCGVVDFNFSLKQKEKDFLQRARVRFIHQFKITFQYILIISFSFISSKTLSNILWVIYASLKLAVSILFKIYFEEEARICYASNLAFSLMVSYTLLFETIFESRNTFFLVMGILYPLSYKIIKITEETFFIKQNNLFVLLDTIESNFGYNHMNRIMYELYDSITKGGVYYFADYSQPNEKQAQIFLEKISVEHNLDCNKYPNCFCAVQDQSDNWSRIISDSKRQEYHEHFLNEACKRVCNEMKKRKLYNSSFMLFYLSFLNDVCSSKVMFLYKLYELKQTDNLTYMDMLFINNSLERVMQLCNQAEFQERFNLCSIIQLEEQKDNATCLLQKCLYQKLSIMNQVNQDTINLNDLRQEMAQLADFSFNLRKEIISLNSIIPKNHVVINLTHNYYNHFYTIDNEREVSKLIKHFSKAKNLQMINYYQHIFSSSNQSCIVFSKIDKDERGKILKATHNFFQLFGHKDYEGKNITILMDQNISQNHNQFISSYLNTLNNSNNSLKQVPFVLAKNKEGWAVPVQINLKMEFFNSQIDGDIGIACQIKDINDLNSSYFMLSTDELKVKLCSQQFFDEYLSKYLSQKQIQKLSFDLFVPRLQKIKFTSYEDFKNNIKQKQFETLAFLPSQNFRESSQLQNDFIYTDRSEVQYFTDSLQFNLRPYKIQYKIHFYQSNLMKFFVFQINHKKPIQNSNNPEILEFLRQEIKEFDSERLIEYKKQLSVNLNQGEQSAFCTLESIANVLCQKLQVQYQSIIKLSQNNNNSMNIDVCLNSDIQNIEKDNTINKSSQLLVSQRFTSRDPYRQISHENVFQSHKLNITKQISIQQSQQSSQMLEKLDLNNNKINIQLTQMNSQNTERQDYFSPRSQIQELLSVNQILVNSPKTDNFNEDEDSQFDMIKMQKNNSIKRQKNESKRQRYFQSNSNKQSNVSTTFYNPEDFQKQKSKFMQFQTFQSQVQKEDNTNPKNSNVNQKEKQKQKRQSKKLKKFTASMANSSDSHASSIKLSRVSILKLKDLIIKKQEDQIIKRAKIFYFFAMIISFAVFLMSLVVIIQNSQALKQYLINFLYPLQMKQYFTNFLYNNQVQQLISLDIITLQDQASILNSTASQQNQKIISEIFQINIHQIQNQKSLQIQFVEFFSQRSQIIFLRDKLSFQNSNYFFQSNQISFIQIINQVLQSLYLHYDKTDNYKNEEEIAIFNYNNYMNSFDQFQNKIFSSINDQIDDLIKYSFMSMYCFMIAISVIILLIMYIQYVTIQKISDVLKLFATLSSSYIQQETNSLIQSLQQIKPQQIKRFSMKLQKYDNYSAKKKNISTTLPLKVYPRSFLLFSLVTFLVLESSPIAITIIINQLYYSVTDLLNTSIYANHLQINVNANFYFTQGLLISNIYSNYRVEYNSQEFIQNYQHTINNKQTVISQLSDSVNYLQSDLRLNNEEIMKYVNNVLQGNLCVLSQTDQILKTNCSDINNGILMKGILVSVHMIYTELQQMQELVQQQKSNQDLNSNETLKNYDDAYSQIYIINKVLTNLSDFINKQTIDQINFILCLKLLLLSTQFIFVSAFIYYCVFYFIRQKQKELLLTLNYFTIVSDQQLITNTYINSYILKMK
ncbi:hypothetical protein ABPG72_019509 [Tetrahymena utriculariae]